MVWWWWWWWGWWWGGGGVPCEVLSCCMRKDFGLWAGDARYLGTRLARCVYVRGLSLLAEQQWTSAGSVLRQGKLLRQVKGGGSNRYKPTEVFIHPGSSVFTPGGVNSPGEFRLPLPPPTRHATTPLSAQRGSTTQDHLMHEYMCIYRQG